MAKVQHSKRPEVEGRRETKRQRKKERNEDGDGSAEREKVMECEGGRECALGCINIT